MFVRASRWRMVLLSAPWEVRWGHVRKQNTVQCCAWTIRFLAHQGCSESENIDRPPRPNAEVSSHRRGTGILITEHMRGIE